jgi:hypothetical protein
VKISSTYEVGTYVRERGGRLYIWVRPASRWSDYGFLRVTTRNSAPDSVSFAAHDAGGFDLLIDETLPLPDVLELTLRRRPWGRVAVHGLTLGAAGAGGGGDEGEWWDSGGAGGNGGGGNGGG